MGMCEDGNQGSSALALIFGITQLFSSPRYVCGGLPLISQFECWNACTEGMASVLAAKSSVGWTQGNQYLTNLHHRAKGPRS